MAELTLSQALSGLPPELLRGALASLGERGAEIADEVTVAGVAHDSRSVRPKDLFVAWEGARFDGRRFAQDAVRSGASAVLASPGPLADRPAVPWIELDDPRRWMAPIAASIHGHPDRRMLTVGVTGTNGKTTVVRLLERILGAAGRPCGSLGTLGYRFGEHDFGGERTTPEASELFRVLEEMLDLGARAIAMEVSSHALDQGRVGEMRYDVAAFTNLTRDHLDYHHTMERYFDAKRLLFDQLADDGGAAVGIDDEYGARLGRELAGRFGAAGAAGDRRLLTFGADPGAAVRPDAVQLDLAGMRGTVTTPRGRLEFESRLIGRYNLLNVLAAVAVCELLEIEHGAVREALAGQPFVPGRLDPVIPAAQPPSAVRQAPPVLVDFAHTPGALEATLESMREIWNGRIAIVFGCGGEKDRGKRQMMGEAAGRLADLAIATSDNPRRESPEEILREVVVGIERSGGRYEVVVDRRDAIRRALELAFTAADGESWAVLVAGKGHEREQIIGDRKLPFDDREVALQLLEELGRADVDG
ncbi:MAG: UDP-N-acetylmuramoyl-L-alanyl-D-glutamate--2,6-diaminopimelate ligase [Acidobacteria bacterium]|nr:MAG: UDP-N-acetylmuramoyl-L-alanyl-D-glutamate--2,6-diaminopimelate ligase [Acidobacteriota bacterium]